VVLADDVVGVWVSRSTNGENKVTIPDMLGQRCGAANTLGSGAYVTVGGDTAVGIRAVGRSTEPAPSGTDEAVTAKGAVVLEVESGRYVGAAAVVEESDSLPGSSVAKRPLSTLMFRERERPAFPVAS
jgi:hypothetical protein